MATGETREEYLARVARTRVTVDMPIQSLEGLSLGPGSREKRGSGDIIRLGEPPVPKEAGGAKGGRTLRSKK